MEYTINAPEPDRTITFDVFPSDDHAIIGAQIAATLDSLMGCENGARLIINLQPIAAHKRHVSER